MNSSSIICQYLPLQFQKIDIVLDFVFVERKMQKLIETLDIPYPNFVGFLQTMNGFVAGSAALCTYMEDGNTDSPPTWQPNDVDIWIPVPKLSLAFNQSLRKNDLVYDNIIHTSNSIRSVIRLFFERYGYHDIQIDNNLSYKERKEKWENEYKVDRLLSVFIHRVIYLYKGDKKIQVILTADIPLMDVLDDFDFSVCKIAWKPDDVYVHGVGFTQNEARLKKGTVLTNRLVQRMQKYIQRGFKVVIEGDDIQ